MPTAADAPSFCNEHHSIAGFCGVALYMACNINPPNSAMNIPTMAKKWDDVGVTLAPTKASTKPGMATWVKPDITVIMEITMMIGWIDFLT